MTTRQQEEYQSRKGPTKLAQKLHAHSVQYAQNLTSTIRATEIKNTQHNLSVLGPHASRNPPDPH
eukprot:1138006-Pelagomonas_calceolata.AAC.3